MPADEAIEQFRTAPRAPVVLRKPLPRTFEPDYGIELPEPVAEVNVLARCAQIALLLLAAGCFAAFVRCFF